MLEHMWTWTTAWIAERRHQMADQPSDRGDILQTVVITALGVGIVIVAMAIILGKTTDAANSINTK